MTYPFHSENGSPNDFFLIFHYRSWIFMSFDNFFLPFFITRKEIWWLNILSFVRRSTILESKPELLEKVVKKSHHNGEAYYVNHYLLSVWNLSLIMRHNSSIVSFHWIFWCKYMSSYRAEFWNQRVFKHENIKTNFYHLWWVRFTFQHSHISTTVSPRKSNQ